MPIASLQRSVLNVGFVSGGGNEYRFINHFHLAEQYGPTSLWATGTPWTQSIASDGWPNVPITVANNKPWAAGLRIPSSVNYGAPGTTKYYVVSWKGNGEIFLSLNSGSWTWGATEQALSSNVTLVSGGNRWRTTSGADSKLVIGYTGPAQLFNVYFYSSDPNSDGSRFRDFKFYRSDDEADLLAGKIFRTPYKQTIVDYCPSVLRFMDWVGGNNARQTRFDTTRTLPNYPAWGGGNAGSNWVASPPYGETTGTNQYALASATGMPVAMRHGEIATCRIGNSAVRCGTKTVTGITNNNPGVVTSTAHGFTTGDIISHIMTQITFRTGTTSSGSTTMTGVSGTSLVAGMLIEGPGIAAGTKVVSVNSGASTLVMSIAATANGNSQSFVFTPMPNLHRFPVTITVIDADNYSIGVDTTSWGTFGAATAAQYVTLNVGSRGDYPVCNYIVTSPMASLGNSAMVAGDYKTFIFDKTISLKYDGAGNPIYGVWMFNESGNNNGHNGGVPLEICVALVNEVNAMSPAQPISMWTNIPHMGMSSMDPDYASAANWGVNALNVILNGNTVGGVTYAGLTASAMLFVEYSNETWNFANSTFCQSYYCAYRGYLRWPASGTFDLQSMTALRSTIAMEDIRASAYYNSSRIKFIIGGQGTLGIASGTNLNRVDGTTYYLNDAANTWGPTSAPMAHHDYFAFAAYFVASSSFETANLATLVASWVSHIGDSAAQEADYAAYIAGVVDYGVNAGETTYRYGAVLLPAYAAKMATYGKSAIMYEGGWDKAISPISAGGQVSVTIPFASGVFNSTDTITSVNSSYVSAVSVGDFAYGYGIPDNTTVIAKPTSTSLQLSNAVTISTSIGQFFCMTPQNAFLRATRRSRTWANAMQVFFSYFNRANAAMPSDYVQADLRWGHNFPTAYGASNTEWGDIDLPWQMLALRNRGKQQFVGTI